MCFNIFKTVRGNIKDANQRFAVNTSGKKGDYFHIAGEHIILASAYTNELIRLYMKGFEAMEGRRITTDEGDRKKVLHSLIKVNDDLHFFITHHLMAKPKTGDTAADEMFIAINSAIPEYRQYLDAMMNMCRNNKIPPQMDKNSANRIAQRVVKFVTEIEDVRETWYNPVLISRTWRLMMERNLKRIEESIVKYSNYSHEVHKDEISKVKRQVNDMRSYLSGIEGQEKQLERRAA